MHDYPATSEKREATRPMAGFYAFWRRFRADDAGSYLVWNMLWVGTFLMIGGLALDSSNAWRVRGQLQHTADAAALAAALYPTDATAGKAAALRLTELNMPEDVHGKVMEAADVEYGFWDEDSGTFSPLAASVNAVRVQAGRLEQRSNGLDTYLLAMAGVGSWDVSVQSIAMVGEGDPEVVCPSMMVSSQTSITSQGFSDFGPGVCLHANDGVTTGIDDLFPSGARIGSPDANMNYIAALRFGSAEVDEIVAEELFAPTFTRFAAGQVRVLDVMYFEYWLDFSSDTSTTFFDDPDGPRLPPNMLDPDTFSAALQRETGDVSIMSEDEAPLTPVPGDETVYLAERTIITVDGDVELSGGTELRSVAIIASGSIRYTGTAGLHLEDVFLVAGGDITLDASVTLGNPATYCGDGIYDSYIFARGSIDFDGSAGAYGVMAAANRILTGEGFVGGGGYLEAVDPIVIDPSTVLSGCDTAPSSDVFAVSLPTEAPVEGALLVR